MVKCVAQMCGECGVVHNIEDTCPAEALWRQINHKTYEIPVGNGYLLEVTPDLEVQPLPSDPRPYRPPGIQEPPEPPKLSASPVRRGPIHEIKHETKEFAKIPEVKLAEELENGLWTGWMEMEAYYEGLKGVIHGDVEA